MAIIYEDGSVELEDDDGFGGPGQDSTLKWLYYMMSSSAKQGRKWDDIKDDLKAQKEVARKDREYDVWEEEQKEVRKKYIPLKYPIITKNSVMQMILVSKSITLLNSWENSLSTFEYQYLKERIILM